MAHSCPECNEACYCHGDVDDVFVGELAECSHCDDVFGGIDEDNDDGARTCLHISATERAGGFLVCDECGSDVTRELYGSRAL